MNKKKIALILLYTVSGTIILLGLMWLFATKLLYYQQTFLGISYEEVAPKVADLFLILYKSIGANYLVVGVTLALLTRGPFSKGDVWARRIILIMILIFAVPFTFGALKVGSPTFWVPIVMVVIVSLALFISKSTNGSQ